MIHLLDHGYVRLVSTMGTDTDVVNAARVSYDRAVDTMTDRDEKLLEFLIKNKHDSVLRHCTATFEVYAPLMVARQWWKHVVSSSFLDDSAGWNESSRRYVTENETFYIPDPTEWRSAPANSKQGSGEPLDNFIGAKHTVRLEKQIKQGLEYYREALEDGVAPELARLFLPAYGLYVRWRWTASLNALLNFLSLRLGYDAQAEITEYAQAIETLARGQWPLTVAAWEQWRV